MIGAVLWVLGPGGIGVGVVGGGLLGALHHRGLGLNDDDQSAISAELEGGHAAVGVLTDADEAAAVADYLAHQGGKSETHQAPDEALDHAASRPTSWNRTTTTAPRLPSNQHAAPDVGPFNHGDMAHL